MQALLRTAGRRAAAAAGQVRRMSSGVSHEEEVKQMNLWRNVTIAGAGSPALQSRNLLATCTISLVLLTLQLRRQLAHLVDPPNAAPYALSGMLAGRKLPNNGSDAS